MHGRVKTRTTEEQKEIARQEKCKKAKAYQNTMKVILEKREKLIYDQEALDLTAGLLLSNPDIITLWNYRREIFQNMRKEEELESYQKLLERDLTLTEQCLRVNPKSYGSWHHRIWILDNLPQPDWGKELTLCTRYLQLDERNFHCWDYRRIVTQRSNVPDLSEYEYTLEKIEANFSNYSAWHLRSKLLPRIFPDPGGRFPIDEGKHKDELELVESAAFTDPNDQSAWFYLRWLLDLTEPRISFVFVELRDENILVVTSRSVKLGDESTQGVNIKVTINGKTCDGEWRSASEYVQSCIWHFKLKEKVEESDSVELILEDGVECDKHQLQLQGVVRNKPNFYPIFSDSLRETLLNQISSCEQLLELEPDSKWTLLTSVFLMLSMNSLQNENQIIQGLDKLCEIDPLRKGYYMDLRSKVLIQLAIIREFGTGGKFQLTRQNLTALYHSQYLHDREEIDLSGNLLTSDALPELYAFLSCKVLNLAGNKITSLEAFPGLPKLETLLLDDNLIEEVHTEWVGRFPKLKTLSLGNNPFKKDAIEELTLKLSNIKLTFSGGS